MFRRKTSRAFLFFVLLLGLVGGFQNCSSGFRATVDESSTRGGRSMFAGRNSSDVNLEFTDAKAGEHLRRACYCVNCGEKGAFAAEYATPELVTKGFVQALAITPDELAILNQLAVAYQPNFSGLTMIQYENVTKETATGDFWGAGQPSGVPVLDTKEGWHYHLLMMIRSFDRGARGFYIAQASLRFKQTPVGNEKYFESVVRAMRDGSEINCRGQGLLQAFDIKVVANASGQRIGPLCILESDASGLRVHTSAHNHQSLQGNSWN